MQFELVLLDYAVVANPFILARLPGPTTLARVTTLVVTVVWLIVGVGVGFTVIIRWLTQEVGPGHGARAARIVMAKCAFSIDYETLNDACAKIVRAHAHARYS